MKYRHVFWAFILISIGIIFMLKNFGVLDFGFFMIFNILLPIPLILWGISILPIRDLFKIIGLVIVLAITLIFSNHISQKPPSWMHIYNSGGFNSNNQQDDEDTTSTSNYQPQNLSVPFDSLARKGVLHLDAAAGNFNVNGATSDFLSFAKNGDIGDYSLTTTNENHKKKVILTLEKSGIRHSVSDNNVEIKLSDKPSWDLELEIGGAELNMDLRNYKIDSATIDGGAASVNVQIGSLTPLTVMTFNAGAATIKIEIPKESGCQIKSESFMISKDFEGFTKKGDGIYQTANFTTGKNKIYLTFKTALATLEVTRY